MEAGLHPTDNTLSLRDPRLIPARETLGEEAPPLHPNASLRSRIESCVSTDPDGDVSLQNLGCAVIEGVKEEYLLLCRHGFIRDGKVVPGLPASFRCGGYRRRDELMDLVRFLHDDDGIQTVIDTFGLSLLNADAIRDRILRDGIKNQPEKEN